MTDVDWKQQYHWLLRRAWSAVFIVLLAASPAFLTGCNTMEGVGEDVEEAGEKIEDAAE